MGRLVDVTEFDHFVVNEFADDFGGVFVGMSIASRDVMPELFWPVPSKAIV